MEDVMGTGALEGSTLTALGSAVVAVLVSISTYSWKARGIQADLEKKIEDRAVEVRKEAIERHDELRKAAAERHDESLRLNGEGMAALRQKAVDMELWSRDNFVRRADFQNAVDGFMRNLDSLRVDMNGKFARTDDKLDQIIQGKVGPTSPHR